MATVQIRVSDEVYEALRFFKLFPNEAFNDTIRMLVEGFSPGIFEKITYLRNLEEKDHREALAERILIQRELDQDIHNLLWHGRQRLENHDLLKYLDSVESAESDEEREFIKNLERERHKQRMEILREKGLVRRKKSEHQKGGH
jgi:predicted CopG family antitoxin